MADAEYLDRLRQSVGWWNEWREKNFEIRPDLNGADLSGADLSGADLSSADLSGADLYGVDLSDANLNGADLCRVDLRDADLRGANLRDADLSDADLSDADLSDADLSDADLRGVNLSDANLSSANLRGVNLWRANLSGASGIDLHDIDLSDADLSGVNFRGIDLSGFDLRDINLSNADLSDVDLSSANLRGANLSSTDLSGSNLRNADLSRTNLRGINLSGANLNGVSGINFRDISLSGVNLRQADLRGTDLRGVDLRNIDLSGANLRQTDLRGADLRGVDLHDANLRGSNLSETNLSKTNLRGINLSDANLSRANFCDANLRGANLHGANLYGATLRRVNLSGFDLSGFDLSCADLSDANLGRAQVLGTSFKESIFTGACLEYWNTNSTTSFEGIICEYVYLKANQQERRPREGIFKPGEFSALFQQAIDTVDLIFKEGIDWQAFFQSFQDLRSQYADQDLSIQAIEKKQGGAFIVRVEVAEDADKSAIEISAKELYETKLILMEHRYRDVLQAKEGEIVAYKEQSANLMEIIKLQASRPINVEASAIAGNSNRKIDLHGAQFGGGYAETVQGNQIGGTVNNYGFNTKDATRLLSVLRDQSQTFPTDQKDDANDIFGDLERDFKEAHPDQNRISRRLKKLVVLGAAIDTIASGAANISGDISTFTNHVLELTEKLGIPIEQVQLPPSGTH